TRENVSAGYGWAHTGRLHGFAAIVEPLSPSLLDEWLAQEKLAVRAIQNVEEAVAIAPQHCFSGSAFPNQIGQHRNLRGIEVPFVARRELKIPLEFAGIGIEGNDAIRIE